MRQRGAYSVNASHIWRADGGSTVRFPRKDYAGTGPRWLVSQCRNQVSVHPYLALEGWHVYVHIMRSIARLQSKVSRAPISFSLYIIYFFYTAVRDIEWERLLTEDLTSHAGRMLGEFIRVRSTHICMDMDQQQLLYPAESQVSLPRSHVPASPPLRAATRATHAYHSFLSAGGATFKGHWMRSWMK